MEVFVECGAGLPEELFPNTEARFTRKHFMRPHEFHEFQKRYKNIDIFQTMMHYLDPIWYQTPKGKWLIDAEVSLKASDFYLDFDYLIENEDHYQMLKDDVEIAIRYLTIILKIPKDQIQLYYSGYKGIHMIVPMTSLGLLPHVSLNKIYKDLIEDINNYIKNKTLDTGIYDDKRLFRVPNTFNFKGQRYKIPLTLEEFRTMRYEEVRELAKGMRTIFIPPIQESLISKKILESMIKEWTERAKKQHDFSGRILNIKELPPCIKAMHEKVFQETVDERNNSGTALVSFYMQRGFTYEQTLDIVMQWGLEQCSPALKTSDIETIVNSVYVGKYRYGCGTFERVSGVCDKNNCPLFNRAKKEPKKDDTTTLPTVQSDSASNTTTDATASVSTADSSNSGAAATQQ